MEGLRAAILSIGDELLLGRTVDTNSAWLSDRLSLMGLPVVEQRSVGDDRAAIQAALAGIGRNAALVCITGGLGPTADDLTVPAVAEGLGLAPESLGSPVPNPLGTAAGRWVAPSDEAPALLLMPGIPREMCAVFEQAEPTIRTAFAGRLPGVHYRTLTTTGIGESRLAPDVQPLIDTVDGVSVAFLPDLEGVDLRLTVRGRTAEEAAILMDRAEGAIAHVVDPWRLRCASGDVVESITDALLGKGWTVALGESCTGGGISHRMTSRPGSSRVLQGGVVAYANSVKVALLGVPYELIQEFGAVSESVAMAMAQGAAEALGADCGIGITGIAGPEGGSDEKPVGTVSYAACIPGAAEVTTRTFRGDRESVRRRSAQAAMVQLLRLVERSE